MCTDVLLEANLLLPAQGFVLGEQSVYEDFVVLGYETMMLKQAEHRTRGELDCDDSRGVFLGH